ncbi:MAG TPA: endonuclease domain-containing protein, partial [Aquabacterium sp.]|nr:endonuclease domain-containing protein [Aquabacterium sp.]
QFMGLKFRRQHPVGKYIADFACVEFGLVVELDGGQHVDQHEYDAKKSEEMEKLGFRTLRFWNHEVLNETQAVLEKLRQVATTLTPTLSRKRERE